MTEEQLIQRKAMLLQLFEDPAYAPMKLKELAMLFDIPKEQREDLKEVLDTLLTEGKIGISQKGKYGKPDLGSIAGVFFGHPKGFGFVAVEGLDQDIFIPEDKTGGALHGDTVLVSAETKPGNGKRAEGHVVKVLEHANEQIIGYYQKNKSFGFVIPITRRFQRMCSFPRARIWVP